MKLIRLYVQIEHYNDWSYYTRDFNGIRVSVRQYYPFIEQGYIFEVAVISGEKGDVVRSFVRRFRYLGNIIDVISVSKINAHMYELIFLGDIKGMLKYLILKRGGIVMSVDVSNGIKDITAYFFNKNIHELKTSFNELYSELSSYGKVLSFNANRISRTPVFTAPTYSLTDLERKILQAAYHMGFFNYPRSVSLDDLAKEFNISKATINIHLRNALRKLLSSHFY